MLTISRQLAKHIRSVIRRALQISPSQSGQVVWLSADETGLHVRAQNHHGIAEYHQPGTSLAESIPISVEALAACEGAKADETVSIERRTDSQVLLRWDDHSVPQQFQFDAKKLHPEPPPTMPEAWGTNPPSLLTALDNAMRMTASNPTRYGIDCVQLRPAEGQIAVTDSRQLLVQTGYSFSWSNDVLVQRTQAFRCGELVSDRPVEVGVTANHFVVRTGPWTLWLALEKQGRFPEFENVIPAADSAKTRLRITEEDAAYLLNVISRLPQEEPDNPRISVDLNGSVALLARGSTPAPATRVVLSNSQRSGDELRIDSDRQFLAQALQLGFRDFELSGPESPIVCRDERRTYLWSLIQEVPAIVVGPDAIHLASPINTTTAHRLTRHVPEPRMQHPSTHERTTPKMPRNRIAETLAGASPPEPNQLADAVPAHTDEDSKQVSFDAVLQRAESVKSALRQAHSQVNELVAAIKRHRKQTRLMQSTLASLRQLQTLDV